MNIPPLPHAKKRKKMIFTKFSQLRLAFDLGKSSLIELPETDKGKKIRRFIQKALMSLIRFFFLIQGPYPGILDTQGRSNDTDLA